MQNVLQTSAFLLRVVEVPFRAMQVCAAATALTATVAVLLPHSLLPLDYLSLACQQF